MKVAVVKETRLHEKRVAASPDTVKRMIGMGLDVVVETGAGAGSSFPDAAYAAAGATIAPSAAEAAADAQVVLKVQRPQTKKDGGADELKYLKPGTVLIGILAALQNKDAVAAYAKAGLSAFAMELIPRITRAQSMDVLSSQSNLAGYKAVIDAAEEYGHAFPMMMTAAGTVPPARVTIMGAGVAGLQAIATARRLGAIVSAFDVRPVAKEQVESLGATFISVDSEETRSAETSGGYAKEMSEDYQRRQREKIHEVLKKQDIVICTALIPGRRSPILVTKEMIADMKPGSVIVDLAVEAGGNAEGAVFGETVITANDVKIVGHANVPSRIAVDASSLYARNILNFLTLLVDKETKALKIDTSDEIVKGTLLTQDGAVVHPSLAPAPVPPPAAAADSAAS
ncbi:MAG TPA: Re/Si-specific NAD(P)(+) transhydrogenase subunit alpha [Stellaceae bacterium]|nr:Re/Si-specific NAD(P)(+) transhydrogenase subunit alpha [Stellaceae bacterium]